MEAERERHDESKVEEVEEEEEEEEDGDVEYIEIDKNPIASDLMLPYESSIFTELHESDSSGGALLVTSNGLGLHRIFLSILKLYSDPSLLVFVLNTTKDEEAYFLERMALAGVDPLPRIINNDTPATERQKIYLQGGVHFVTSRIFVVDLLTEKVPLELTTGILVYRAHKILESCQEAFILRLFREKNEKGFIKAFSESPVSFTSGFCHVGRVMKNLFVNQLLLWPRFHVNVKETLLKNPVDSIELSIPLTPAMIAIQTSLIDLISVCLKELKAASPLLDADELTPENAITRSFDYLVKLYVDPILHSLGAKSRQLLADIRTLRRLLTYVMHYDSVTFFTIVQSIWQSHERFESNAGWMFFESADALYAKAKERVLGRSGRAGGGGGGAAKRSKEDENGAIKDESNNLTLEESPKWSTLLQVLKEIDDEYESAKIEPEDEEVTSIPPTRRTLIVAEDDKTCAMLRDLLKEGARGMLLRRYILLQDKEKNKARIEMAERELEALRGGGVSKGGEKSGGGDDKGKKKKNGSELTLTQMVDLVMEKTDGDPEGRVDWSKSRSSAQAKSKSGRQDFADGEEKEKAEDETSDAYRLRFQGSAIILHPTRGCQDSTSLTKVLVELQPQTVILYDADSSFVRQLEIYRACQRKEESFKVYFLMYAHSTEEQKYLTSLRKEKEAFEYLIKEKSTLVVDSASQGPQKVVANDLNPEAGSSSSERSSRKAGGRREEAVDAPLEDPKVIVDLREFRSELPSLIHRRGLKVDPVTLEVGDYILTPEICVERKSLPDLIHSLNCGRLYNQAISMTRHYRRPILLIEFDQSKSFCLDQSARVPSFKSSGVDIKETQAKLTLLTIHFPGLRILWSANPYLTAEMFEAIKKGRPEPHTATAIAIGQTELSDGVPSSKYSPVAQDFVLKLPGVDSKNYRRLMNAVVDLKDLSRKTREELAAILDSRPNADKLYDFFHQSNRKLVEAKGGFSKKQAPPGGGVSGTKRNFKYFKRKK